MQRVGGLVIEPFNHGPVFGMPVDLEERGEVLPDGMRPVFGQPADTYRVVTKDDALVLHRMRGVGCALGIVGCRRGAAIPAKPPDPG